MSSNSCYESIKYNIIELIYKECCNKISRNIFSLILPNIRPQPSLICSSVCREMNVRDTKWTVSKKNLQEMESALAGVRPRPPYTDMARWLASTQGDIQEALARIKENSSWRQRKMVDSFLHWKPPHVLSKYFPGGLSGFDSEDHYCIILQRYLIFIL